MWLKRHKLAILLGLMCALIFLTASARTRTRQAPPDQSQPEIAISVIASRAWALPNDSVTYFINVWSSASEPSEITIELTMDAVLRGPFEGTDPRCGRETLGGNRVICTIEASDQHPGYARIEMRVANDPPYRHIVTTGARASDLHGNRAEHAPILTAIPPLFFGHRQVLPFMVAP